MSVAAWAAAIDVDLDEQGVPGRPCVARHIRQAVAASANLLRSQIMRGLREAYAPFAVDETVLRELLDGVLTDLVRLGELTEFQSQSGAGYVVTPERWIDLGDGNVVVLGASALEPATSADLVRRVSLEAANAAGPAPRISLIDEMGPPAWRLHLVEQGGTDTLAAGPPGLFAHLGRLAAAGERLENLGPDAVRVVSGRGAYFGRETGPRPEGRWEALKGKGIFCAARNVQYGWRPCLVVAADESVTAWETRDWDLWRWAVVGQTLATSDPVARWLEEESEFVALTPPPFQLSRLLTLAGTSERPWRWRVSKSVAETAMRLLGAADH